MSRFSSSQYVREVNRNVLRITWMMQVCTIVAGHRWVTTSGSPFRPSQTVTDREEHVLDPAVAQVGQHTHPELRALPAGPGLQAHNLPLAGQGDPDRSVERPVRDLPVPDLDHDGVDEHRDVR